MAVLQTLLLSLRPGRVFTSSVREPERRPGECASLTSLTFEGNTTITSATAITSGTTVVSTDTTLTNLPPYCRAVERCPFQRGRLRPRQRAVENVKTVTSCSGVEGVTTVDGNSGRLGESG